MTALRGYLFSVIVSVLICSILLSCVKNTAFHKVIQLICGLFISLSLFQPLGEIKIPWDNKLLDNLRREAEAYSDTAHDRSYASISSIIKDETEAYILDKAQPYCDEIRIEVILTDGNPPIPQKVYITANPSAYGKLRIEQILTEDLSITKENQIWTVP